MVETGGNVDAAKLAVEHELRRAGFDLDEDSDEWTAEVKTVFAVLADGRSVQRDFGGNWEIVRHHT